MGELDTALNPRDHALKEAAESAAKARLYGTATWLDVGHWLSIVQENAYWSGLYKTFSEYVKDLDTGFGTSWINRGMNASRMIATGMIDLEEAIAIGKSKLSLLLPYWRRGELTEDLIERARVSPSYAAFRHELKGDEIPKGKEKIVVCPHCGYKFDVNKQAND